MKWVKRLIVYIAGLFILSVGVGVSIASKLGVSPVSALPYVISRITAVQLGLCTTGIFILYLVIQIFILRREFKPVSFLQIGVSFLFGFFVNVSTGMMSFLDFTDNYAFRLLLCAVGIIVVGIGVFLYVNANVIPLPTEGLMLAIARKTGLTFGTMKIIFDVTVVGVAVFLSFIFLHRLEGVREGTVFAAIFVGFVVKFLNKMFSGRLKVFLEIEITDTNS